MTKFRQSLFFIIVGTNGTGKTTLLKKLVGDIERKALIIDPDGMEWRDIQEIPSDKVGEMSGGYARVLAPTPSDLDELINYQNGSLVLDDCRYYLKARMDESIRKILVRRRQNSVDVFAVAHGLSEVPATFYTFATHLVIFKTNDSLVRLRNNTDKEKIQRLKNAIDSVNQHSDKHHYQVFNISDL
jgi:ABC-type cobalamin/Fe3+-siderophores transport system ATPase subunit